MAEALRSHVATGAPVSAPPASEYLVEINDAWCKQCGICVAFCPRKGLSISQGRLRHDGDCAGCGLCELHCPDEAIAVRRRDRVFARTASDPEGGAGDGRR